MRTKTTRLIGGLLAIIITLSMLPIGGLAVFSDESTEGSITAYVSVGKNGRLAIGKDGDAVAEIPVTLTGKESYTLDDALRAVHNICYEGGSAAGYESYNHETYGLNLKTLWGDSGGMFGYQVNRGTASVSGLDHVIKDGDYIDAYINQSAYPDNEAYSAFNKSVYKAVAGSEIGLKLTQAGYDEDWNTVFSGCEGAAITVNGVPAFKTTNGVKTPVITNSSGYASFTIEQPGTYIVSASKNKEACGNTVAAITAPVCVVTVTEAPRLESLNISNVYNDKSNFCKITPAFDPAVTEYNISVPDYSSTIWPYAKLAEGFEDKAVCYYSYNSMFGGFGWSSSNSINTSGGYFGAVIYDKTNNMSNEDIRYTVNIDKHATLTELTVNGIGTLEFNRDVNNGYQYYVDGLKDGVDITVRAYKSNYIVTVCGEEVTDGEPYRLIYKWDENGKMEVPVAVSGDNVKPYAYTLILEKQPLNDTPYIMTQPSDADYIIGAETAELNVVASANGKLNYQWYSSVSGSIEDGVAIAGATDSSYAPPSKAIGTVYYYCVITNADKTINNTAVSSASRITVDPDPTPKAIILNPGESLKDYDWSSGYVYNVGDEADALTVSATSDAEGGVWDYKWYSVSTPYNIRGYSSAPGNSTGESYEPSTELSLANDSGKFYACRVNYTFKGKTYTSWASTGMTYTIGDGDNAETYDVNGAYVFIKTDKADAPIINRQPIGASYIEGDRTSSLSISVSKADGGKLSYQWYENDILSNEGGAPIKGAESSSYALGAAKKVGSKYYYCVITNTVQGYTASVVSEPVEITVKAVSDLIGDKLVGSGSLEDPYLIENAQDYQDIADLVAVGLNFKGSYLKQTAENITLPDNWTPIGVSKTKASFSGILDGDNKTVTVPEGGMPLLGYVVGAEVKNLNIYGKRIAGYGLVNNLEGVGLSGNAVVIDNVTLKSGSSTLKSGLIGTYITTNGFAGCSAAFVVEIRNCIIEENVVIGYDKEQTMIGSFAGRVNGSIENCVSYATVYGKNYVGGILGSRDNAMGTCNVINCKFNGVVEAGGDHVGGIVGGGYSNQTAPNGGKINIQNCSSNASVTGGDKVGGIIGADTYVLQLWGGHILKDNSFAGTVKATGGTYVGGVVGYYGSLNKYDGIAGNYYSSDCGANKGIGFVKYVDTSCETHETVSGAAYVNTADGESGIGGITKTDHNRTDDPLGADAGKLCYTDSTPATAIELIVSGSYKTEYEKGDKLDLSGMVITVVYNDGKSEIISPSDVTLTGFDSEKIGDQEITLNYMGLTAVVYARVMNSKSVITVTVAILGDEKHDCDTDGKFHTMADNNLDVWVPAKKYNVNANATVLDVLNNIFADNGITASNPTGAYIESLTKDGVTLKAADNHVNSGWMFTVNNKHGELAVNQQYLNDGDTIIFHHTDDYKKELDSSDNSDADVIEAVEKLIAAIGASVTIDSESAIIYAREAYDALTDVQKTKVKNYDMLTAAERIMAELKKTDEDETSAAAVEDLIDSIGFPVTLNCENEIVAARNAYNSLTDLQKKLIKNYNKLITAENLLIQLKNPSHAEIYKKTGNYLSKLGREYVPDVGSVGGEWMVIGLVRGDRDVSSEYYENVLNYIKENINEKEQLSRSRSTDNSRVILALTALGYDVTNVGGHNLLTGLTDMSYIKKQGVNGPVWALIALDSHDYEIPANSGAADQTTREKLITCILRAQITDGGWSVSGDRFDSDMTAMALQALSPYYNINAEVKIAVDKALDLLSKAQNDDGDFSSLQMNGEYIPTGESTAQVIAALTALGINPDTDPRFVKNGISAVDALCGYAIESGGFAHTMYGELSGMATEQGYYALTAYFRFLNGERSLYDMKDVTIRKSVVVAPSEDNAKKPDDVAQDNPTKSNGNDQNLKPITPSDYIAVQSPQTEDAYNTIIYIVLATLSISVTIAAISSKRKAKHKY